MTYTCENLITMVCLAMLPSSCYIDYVHLKLFYRTLFTETFSLISSKKLVVRIVVHKRQSLTVYDTRGDVWLGPCTVPIDSFSQQTRWLNFFPCLVFLSDT